MPNLSVIVSVTARQDGDDSIRAFGTGVPTEKPMVADVMMVINQGNEKL
jgi:hypothetical protein